MSDNFIAACNIEKYNANMGYVSKKEGITWEDKDYGKR